jgi:hypothetical protein
VESFACDAWRRTCRGTETQRRRRPVQRPDRYHRGNHLDLTYKARILFTSTYNGFGFAFNEWKDGIQDNFLIAGPNGPNNLQGYAFPVNYPTGSPVGNPPLATPIISLNAWHHIAYSYGGINERLFFDGTIIASRPGTGSFGDSLDLPFVGSLFPDGGRQISFLGYLDTL